MSCLTIALSKGRIAKATMELFAEAGICESELFDDSRKLIFEDGASRLRFFMAKPADVPTYVDHGAADLGIVGKDTLLEEGRSVFELLDMEFGACRIVVAGKPGFDFKGDNNLVVATKYPNIAKDYFYNKLRQTVEIVKLNGSVELGPLVGLSDVIVDIVESGDTLRANGLAELEVICRSSARLIANNVGVKMKNERIAEVVRKLRGAQGKK